jgi:hypothetical protein
MDIKLSVFEQLKRLEAMKGRNYQHAEIADKTGLNRHTVKTVFSNATTRIDLATMAAVLSFFHAEGMPITVAELFTVTTGKALHP